jgi:hypothetical protein
MMTTHRTKLCRWAPALLWLALAGCTSSSARAPSPQPRAALPYARVAVLEFADRGTYPGRAEQFTQALREKLAERTEGTDVIVVPCAAVFGDEDPFTTGRIPVDALTRVRHDYLADALIVGSVDVINPYRPPSLQLNLKLIETAQGTVAYEVNNVWNAADSPVRAAIEAYYQRNIGKDDCRFGPDIFLLSPRYYMRFVADQVVSGITARLALAR